MQDSIKRLIIEPSETFANIEEKPTMGLAILIVTLFGLLSAIPEILVVRDPIWTGAAMLIIVRTIGTIVIWGIMGLVIYGLAVKLSGGSGSLSAILNALGIAAFVRLLQSVIEIMITMGGVTQHHFLMVFIGWYTVLLVLAVREITKITTGRSIMTVAMVGIVALVASLPLTLVEWYIYPSINPDPFDVDRTIARRIDGWQDGDLLEDVESLLINGDFEEVMPERSAPHLDEEVRMTLPRSWEVRAIMQRMQLNVRAKIIMDKVKYEYERAPGLGMRGGACARVAYPHAPLGMPIGWGWSQAIVSREFMAEYRRRREAEAPPEERQLVDPLEYNIKVVRFVEDDELYFSIWLKGEDVEAATAVAMVGLKDDTFNVYYSSETLSGDFDWTELRMRIPAPADTKLVVVGASLWAGGTLLIDDAQLLRRMREEIYLPDPDDPPELMPDNPVE